jgi:hypothetical protein
LEEKVSIAFRFRFRKFCQVVSGESRFLLKWSIEESGPALIAAGLVTSDQFQQILAAIQEATENPDVLILAPRMSLVWARKPLQAHPFSKVA